MRYRSNSGETRIAAGFAAGREHLTDGPTISNIDGVVRFMTSLYRQTTREPPLALSVMVFPEFNRWGRVHANVNAKVKRELFEDCFAAVTLYDTYDRQPQVSGVNRSDVGCRSAGLSDAVFLSRVAAKECTPGREPGECGVAPIEPRRGGRF
jgi:hypothetical protein